MTYPFTVRCTRKKKCREGFYLLINGQRLRFRRKALALAAVADWLRLQRVQIVTVREYVDRNRARIARTMPADITQQPPATQEQNGG